MASQKKAITRRDFLKTAGYMAGAGSVLSSIPRPAHGADSSKAARTVPTRPFGKTGVDVPILSLGGSMDLVSNQLLLKQAVKLGVTYWDTANFYSENSEKGIGKYFARYPEDRKKIFVATKSSLSDPGGWDFHLDKSLERMKTDYIDLFLVHMITSIEKLAPFEKTKAWVDKQKAAGKIRLFGFSSHDNMEACMTGGAKLGWLDGIMVTYNYRLLNTDKMKKAVDACVKAGMGLTAMKTQAMAAHRDTGLETETSLKLTEKFQQKGFTTEQAKLKVVWANPHIASICSKMPNMTILKANVAAALDKTELSADEVKLFNQYAVETCSHYCAGCSRICRAAIADDIPVADLMRYLMYSRSYGDHKMARSLFKEIPDAIRARLADADYSEVERMCPQHLPIGALVNDALAELA